MRILFVCLGNICRSPLAEGIMLHFNKQHLLGWTIDSAGTAGYHIGESPDKRTQKNAASHGIDLSALRARQFGYTDFERFDRIFVMDQNNLKQVLSMAKTESNRSKVKLFLKDTLADKLEEVPDPYYGGPDDFEFVFQLIYRACETFVKNTSAASVQSSNP